MDTNFSTFRRLTNALGIILTVFLTRGAMAQSPGVVYEKVLLPVIITGEIPGGYGSRWATHFTMVNAGTEPIEIEWYPRYPDGCLSPLCPMEPTPPGITFSPNFPAANLPSRLLLVEKQKADMVRFDLRVQDISRQAETWGTEVPVVRERDLRTSRLTLLDIPVGSDFRSTLRIYDPDQTANASVRLRYFGTRPDLRTPFNWRPTGDPTPDELLLDEVRTFPANMGDDRYAWFPAYLQLADFADRLELRTAQRLRVEITPLTQGLRIWAFVAITNNATQHVTTITP